MKLIWVASAVLAIGTAAFASTPPRVLIVPLKSDKTDGVTDQTVANFIARSLQEEGRVAPIVWGIEDPIFRQAALDGKLSDAPDVPTKAQALATAKPFDAKFVLVYVTHKEGAMLSAHADLYSGNRVIWSDDTTSSGKSASMGSTEIGARSIGRTWALKLSGGPFKSFATKLESQTPEAGTGQAPVPTDVPPMPAAVQGADNGPLKTRLAELEKAGKQREAIQELREAIDNAPLDLERRTLLIHCLDAQGDYRGAATEARRAATLFPDKLELRMIAARAWMKASEPNEAREDLNEAVARDPKSTSSLMMLAEVSLLDLAPEKALEPLEMSIKAGATSKALYLRSIARALLGGQDGALRDLAQVTRIDPNPETSIAEERYALLANVLAKATKKAGDDFKTLMQLVVVRPKDAAVRETIDTLRRQTNARQAHLDKVAVPARFKGSHERRALALKLLSLTLTDIESCLNGGGEDALTDARIDLGEALKNSTAAQEALADEIAGAAHVATGQP